MRFTETAVAGCFTVAPEKHYDERGFFARTYSQDDFVARGLSPVGVQCSVSYNREAATLRGLHYQAEPPEAKLVRCSAGRVFDVVVDLRDGSPTWRRWAGVALDARDHLAVYVPPGCAHGFVTLEPGSELVYHMSVPYEPGEARGVRWDDPTLAIAWPVAPLFLSDADRELPHVL